jgi:N-acetylneuraminate synthase
MEIYNKLIGKDHPTYFIAEIGSNYDGDLGRAKELIKIAAEHGADAVKFQHYTANTLVSDVGFRNLDSSVTTHQSEWTSSVSETYDKASLNKNWTEELFITAHENKVGFFTSPYSLNLVDYVEPYVDAFKIGSGDITYTDIIKKISTKDKPILIAAGASTMEEVSDAMELLQNKFNNVCLMQCNTNYEGKIENAEFQNLRVISSFKEMYPEIITGLSCHMPGWTSVLGSVALGARVIEKHFTDDRNREGPDHGFAINPKEWEEMVKETRMLESMLGDGKKKVEKNEEKTVVVQQRCIRVSRDMKIGEFISDSDLVSLRPCPPDGIKPKNTKKLLGKELKKDLQLGEHLTQECLK